MRIYKHKMFLLLTEVVTLIHLATLPMRGAIGPVPPCGQPLEGSFGGQAAFSNGEDQGTGDSCAGGSQYQCVEFVKRVYSSLGVDTTAWRGNAKDYYSSAAAKGLTAYPNNGSTAPQQGDIIVFSGGQYGHVAIISAVSPDTITLVEQNWSATGEVTLPVRTSGGTYFVSPRGTYAVLGWLRSTTPPPTASFILSFASHYITEGKELDIDLLTGALANLTISINNMNMDVTKGDVTIDGNPGFAISPSKGVSFSLGPGVHSISVTVTNNLGIESAPALATVNVNSSLPQWLSFAQGNPGQPGDGVTIDPGPITSIPNLKGSGYFEPSPLRSLSGINDGFNVTVFPLNGSALNEISLGITVSPPPAAKPPQFCPTRYLEIDYGVGSLYDVSLNGSHGFIINVPQSAIQSFLDSLNVNPNVCTYGVNNLALAYIELNMGGLGQLDAAAFVTGQAVRP